MNERYHREVKRGYWYYDGLVKKGVTVAAINYDYWLEKKEADGLDVIGKAPALNDQGEMYLLTWYEDVNCRKPIDYPLSGLDVEEVINQAEMIIRQKIVWTT